MYIVYHCNCGIVTASEPLYYITHMDCKYEAHWVSATYSTDTEAWYTQDKGSNWTLIDPEHIDPRIRTYHLITYIGASHADASRRHTTG
jgi:hypothetical protein